LDYHAERITNQNRIDVGSLHGMGKRGVITGQTRKFGAVGLVLTKLTQTDHALLPYVVDNKKR
jgi:hypothetical protein